MALTAILLGLINIALTVAILLLIGYIVLWLFSWIGFAVPANVQKIYMVIVALVALYMLVALITGVPTWRLVELERLELIARG